MSGEPITPKRSRRCNAVTITPTEYSAAASIGILLRDYVLCREAGATHAEVIEYWMVCTPVDLQGYLRLREVASHLECMDADIAGVNLSGYWDDRKMGKSHAVACTRNRRDASKSSPAPV